MTLNVIDVGIDFEITSPVILTCTSDMLAPIGEKHTIPHVADWLTRNSMINLNDVTTADAAHLSTP